MTRRLRALAMGAAGLLVGGILTTAGIVHAPPAQAALLDPVSCGTVYGLGQSGDADNVHQIYSINTATGALTPNNNVTFAGPINALAVDGDSGTFWLAAQVSGQTSTTVTRVQATTGATTAFTMPLPGAPATSGGLVMGGYNPTTDIYYFGLVSSSVLYIYGFDTTSNTPIPGIIGRVSLGVENNGDFAFDSAGRLYVASPGVLLSLNDALPTTGTATGPLLATTTIANPPPGTLTSVAFGADGLLYVGGNPAGGGDRSVFTVNPSTGAVISTAVMSPANTVGDFASCASPNVITSVKNLPDGRVLPGDQFTLTITGGAISQGNSGTTEGTDSGLQDTAAEMAGPVIGVPGETYTITETGANGAFLSSYDSSWTCFDDVSGTQVGSGVGATGTFTMPDNGFAGSDVLCTFDNPATPPDLSITKTSDATVDSRPGDVVNYTVTATNTGTGPYTNENPAVVFDDLSGVLDDATYNNDAAVDRTGAPAYSSPLLSWQGALPVGESVTLTYSVTLGNTGDGDVRNVAWQPNDPNTPTPPACDPPDGDGNDPDTGEACAEVEVLLPRLTIEKSADQTELPAVGATVEYTITVHNEGPGTYSADSPAIATDDLSNVLDAADYNGDVSASTGTVEVDGSTLSWSGELAPDADAIITYSVTYNGEGDQNLRNLACIPDEDAAPGTPPCDFVQIPGAGLTQWKQVQASATPTVAGTVLTYTLFFKNDGDAAATVDATDYLVHILDDADITSEPTSATLTPVRTGDEIAITGSVPAGATATVTYQVTVKPDGQRGDSVAANFLAGPGGTPPDDPECTPTDAQLPDCTSTPISGLTYSKSVAASESPVQAGTELTYTLTITNTGATGATVNRDDNLSDVLDDATLTGDPESDTGSVTVNGPNGDVLELRGTLAAGETALVTYTVTVNPTGERGNNQANNFLVPPGTTPPTTCDPATEQCTSTPIASYTVSKVADVTSTTPGGVVSYTVTVTNTGAVAYTDVDPASFTDDLTEVLDDSVYNSDGTSSTGAGVAYAAPELSWSGALDVGGTVTVTYSVTVNDPVTGDDILTNAVTPTGPGGDCVDDECVTDTPVASYTVSKSADVDTAMPGDTVTYTVTVTNTGQVDYTDDAPASFTDDLTAVLDDATYNDDVTAGGSVSGTTLTWSGSLDIGETVEVTYTVTVNDPITGDQELTNTVVPTSPGGDCIDGECATTTPIASYTVNKTSSATTAMPGDTVTYTVDVTNTGQVDYTVGDPASFTDDLTDVLDDAVYNLDATNGASVTGSTLNWSGPLAVGDTLTITYSVTIDDPVTGNFVLNNAVIPTSPGGGCADTCDTTTPVGGFEVVKTTDSTEVLPGDVVEYSITVTNTGQVAYTDASPASFSDSLAAVLDDATYNGDAASSSGGGVSYAAPTLGWSGALAIGASVTITYSVTVTSPDTGDQQLDNTVVTPPGSGGNCQEGTSDPACEANVPSGSFTVEKSSDTETALPGDTVTYTITVTNTGEVAYTDDEPAAFTDDLSRVLDDAVYNDDVSAGGSISGDTLSWSGALDVGESIDVTYSVTIGDPVGGDYNLRNVVTPAAPGGECVEGECITDTPVASYTVAKSANVQEVGLGDTIEYTVTVTNIGQVAYTADDPASFVDDLSGVFDDATYNGDASTGSTVEGNSLTWSGALAIGATIDVTYSVTVNNPATGDGSLLNAVTPTGDGGDCVDDVSCTTTTPLAAYRVLKSVSTTQAAVGDVVTFTITMTNIGQVDYTDQRPASFTDDLSSGLSIASYNGDASGGASYDDPVLSWSGPLAVGETTTVTYSMTIHATGEILNVVVTPQGPDANCPADSTDPDCHTTTIVVPPGLAGTGGTLWVAGLTGGLGLVLVGVWFARRRRNTRLIDAPVTPNES